MTNREQHKSAVLKAMQDFFSRQHEKPRFPRGNGDNQQTTNPFVELEHDQINEKNY